MLAQTIRAVRCVGAIDECRAKRVSLDFEDNQEIGGGPLLSCCSVMETTISAAANGRLHERVRGRLVTLPQECLVELRQSYDRFEPRLAQ